MKIAKIIALVKPGKDSHPFKNYLFISILIHLANIVDQNLIPQQIGFRPSKSCTSQILNLTEQIKEEYENKQITDLVLVDLSSAYDTVNYRSPLTKLYDIFKDCHLVKIVKFFLQNG